ncbi:MAG: hypothetical protein MUC87_05360 [Bacteroidia bacterium]|jgi:hypothetical protein|nr:hypothetical protein [Bacteroidia bacterium]
MHTFIEFLKEYKEVITLAGAIIAFVWGVFQYRSTQRWKSAEFALGQLQKFNESPNTKLVQKLLDFSAIRLTLATETETFDATITDKRLTWHLRPHTVHPSLSPTDLAVRNAFDTWFLELEKFEYLIRIGLMDKDATHPYLAYWLDLLGRKRKGRKSEETVKAMHNYIHFYGLKGVARLMRRYGYFSIYDPSVNYAEPQEEANSED